MQNIIYLNYTISYKIFVAMQQIVLYINRNGNN